MKQTNIPGDIKGLEQLIVQQSKSDAETEN